MYEFGCLLAVLAIVLPLFGGMAFSDVWLAVRGDGPWWWQVCPLVSAAAVVATIVGVLVNCAGAAADAAGWIAVGRVAVEASAPEWAAGGRCGLRVTLPRGGQVRPLTIDLVCREEVTSSDSEGTNTAVRELARYRVGVSDLPASVAFTLPADAIPSFTEGDVRIDWRVRVSGRLWRVVRFRSEFVGPTVSQPVQVS